MMTDRCWEELRRAGKALAEDPGDRRGILNIVTRYFEIPGSPEAEAVRVFLDGLCGAFADEEPPEAAQ